MVRYRLVVRTGGMRVCGVEGKRARMRACGHKRYKLAVDCFIISLIHQGVDSVCSPFSKMCLVSRI